MDDVTLSEVTYLFCKQDMIYLVDKTNRSRRNVQNGRVASERWKDSSQFLQHIEVNEILQNEKDYRYFILKSCKYVKSIL